MYVCTMATKFVIFENKKQFLVSFKTRERIDGLSNQHVNTTLQLFSQDYDLFSHIIYVVCDNFKHEWPNDRFLKNFSWKSAKKYFFVLLEMLSLKRGRTPNKPTQYFGVNLS